MTRTWLLVPLPYVALAALLSDVVPLAHAIGHAALLLGLMVAHAACYTRWQPAAPRRILVNEALARLWFALYVVLLTGLLDGHLAVASLGIPLALASWALHARQVKTGYNVATNVLHLGGFLALLAALLSAATP